MSRKGKKVFLSYARSARAQAQKIGQQLRQAGFDVWDPDKEILPGDDFVAHLKVALDCAGAVVVFISPEGMASRSVSYEIEYALGAKHLRRRLIPVMMRPTKDVPWIVGSLESVEYRGPSKTGRQIANLLSQPHDVPEAKSRTI